MRQNETQALQTIHDSPSTADSILTSILTNSEIRDKAADAVRTRRFEAYSFDCSDRIRTAASETDADNAAAEALGVAMLAGYLLRDELAHPISPEEEQPSARVISFIPCRLWHVAALAVLAALLVGSLILMVDRSPARMMVAAAMLTLFGGAIFLLSSWFVNHTEPAPERSRKRA